MCVCVCVSHRADLSTLRFPFDWMVFGFDDRRLVRPMVMVSLLSVSFSFSLLAPLFLFSVFQYREDFNEDVSRWDTSNVKTMYSSECFFFFNFFFSLFQT